MNIWSAIIRKSMTAPFIRTPLRPVHLCGRRYPFTALLGVGKVAMSRETV
jgi:hypothetical protein